MYDDKVDGRIDAENPEKGVERDDAAPQVPDQPLRIPKRELKDRRRYFYVRAHEVESRKGS